MYWSPAESGKVRCELCPHTCLIGEGKAGICRVRVNRGGKLTTLVNGRLSAIHGDPVEKKPLYHFHPGRQILSVGTRGCNLKCSFCQNHHLSQGEFLSPGHETMVTPGELARIALSMDDNTGVAYTYNEPTVFYEYMLAAAGEVRKAGLKNVVVTNGYIQPEPLRELLPVIDAFNVDLKSFSDDFYLRMTGGRLAPVLESLKMISAAGRHLEITLLVIPTLNDSEEEFREMTQWISAELGKEVPLHLSRYFPAWKLTLPPTPVATLDRFAAIAEKELHYVYTGNVTDGRHSSTWCPECRSEVIRREWPGAETDGMMPTGHCRKCGATISGIF